MAGRGRIEQYIIPDDMDINFGIDFNATLGYQIGISIEEKAFMQIANPGVDDAEKGRFPKNVEMTMYFQNDSSINNIIEIGRTYMYEPGDIINLTRIEFNPSQWENMENKEYVGYIEVITIDQNIKEEEEYFDIQAEF